MRSVRTKNGPFAERPFYKDDEIERLCREELESVGLYPSDPRPIRIDRFIEKRLRVTHEYEDLPSGILGYTRFSKGGVSAIVVARSLDDNSTVNNCRIRSTLAHEAGHGLLHAHLFVLTGQSALFPEGQSQSPRVMCRGEKDGTPKTRYAGEWWEYQANRTIGGLLVPAQLAMKALERFVSPAGLLGTPTLRNGRGVLATVHLAKIFEVNPAVASIRLKELFPQDLTGQQTL
jgi:hypothetical protein